MTQYLNEYFGSATVGGMLYAHGMIKGVGKTEESNHALRT